MVNLLLSALSGVLLSFAFEPVGQWWLAPIALICHIYAIKVSQHTAASALIFAFTFNAIVLHWSSTFVGSLPWLILSLGLSLFYLPLALVSRWGIASYPLIFVLLEEIRNRFPFGGFGWARLAYSQAEAPYSRVAAIGGATALSASTLLISLFLFLFINKNIKLIILVPFLSLFIPINLQSVGSTNVLMIQGNVPQLGLDFNSRAKEVFNYHLEKTRKALINAENIDFILWPENAVDVDPFRNQDVSQALNTITQPIIIGAIVHQEEKILNTSILWDSQNPKIYVKQHLTPFGEYIPLRALASVISPYTDKVEDFSSGDKQVVFSIDSAKIAPVICYELIDDQILTDASKMANILAVQTNSATFGMSAESAQQLSITRVRAIEHGRNIISVSTTGYSAVIDYNGQIIEKTSMGTAEAIEAEVGLMEGQTPRDRYGDWAAIGVLVVLLMVSRRAYT